MPGGPPPEPFRMKRANLPTPEKGKLAIIGPRPEEISDTYPAMLRPHQSRCGLNPLFKNILAKLESGCNMILCQVLLLCLLPLDARQIEEA